MFRITEDLINYHYDPEMDIHRFAFTESSAAAVDEWLIIMNEIYSNTTNDAQLRLLLDIRLSGTLPLRYAFSRGKNWAEQQFVHPQVRLAFLHRPDYMLTLASSFFKALGWQHLKVRFFPQQAESQAQIWLKDF